MKIRTILLVLGLILIACAGAFALDESIASPTVSVSSQSVKQRLDELEKRWNDGAQNRSPALLRNIVREAEEQFVDFDRAAQGKLRFKVEYDRLSLDEKIRLHRMLKSVYAELRREAEANAHALKEQSLEQLRSLSSRFEQWRDTVRQRRQRNQPDPVDEQQLSQMRSILLEIVRDAEQGFAEPTQNRAQPISYTESYNQLTLAERAILHSILFFTYSALGNEDMALAHQQMQRQLGGEAPLKTVSEIVGLCRDGRLAEAMFYIEQRNQRLPDNRRLIVNPADALQIQEIAREMRNLSESRGSEAYDEQLRLRRCLAHIYIAEDNTEQATAQFRLILALDPRYSVRQDDTLPATRKVVRVFESAQPKSNTTLPILAALGGLGVLIGSQSGGTVTGNGVSYTIVREAAQSSDPESVEERLRIVYRDQLGRIARSDSKTTGTLYIENLGAVYDIQITAERGTLLPGTVKQGREERIEAGYQISQGEAVIRVRIRRPPSIGGGLTDDGIVLPPERFTFQATAETPGLGAPAQTTFVVTFSDQDALRIQYDGEMIRVPLAGRAISGSSAGISYSLVSSGQMNYQLTIETEATRELRLSWESPNPRQSYRVVLTDRTTNETRLLHVGVIYQFVLQKGERREFKVVLEPATSSRVMVTGLQTSASRGGNSISVVTTLNRAAQLRLSIQDARGRVLHATTRVGTRGMNHFVLAAPELRTAPPGTYLLSLEAQSEDGSVTRRSVPLILTR